MDFFENEFIKIFNSTNIHCFGDSCYLIINHDLNVKVEFITCRFINRYEALRIKMISKKNGIVDSMIFTFKDLFENKILNDMEISFYIWKYRGKLEWHEYQPNSNDYKSIRNKIQDFINIFKYEGETK